MQNINVDNKPKRSKTEQLTIYSQLLPNITGN